MTCGSTNALLAEMTQVSGGSPPFVRLGSTKGLLAQMMWVYILLNPQQQKICKKLNLHSEKIYLSVGETLYLLTGHFRFKTKPLLRKIPLYLLTAQKQG